MRRHLRSALIAVTLAGIAIGPPSSYADARLDVSTASAEHDANRPNDWRDQQCRYRNLDGDPDFSTTEIRRELACATERWTPSRCSDNGCAESAESKVYAVFGCESGFDEHADNPSSSAAGVGQVLDDTWNGWVARFRVFMRRWGLHGSVWNGRANAILSVRVAAGSWSPWEWGSCA